MKDEKPWSGLFSQRQDQAARVLPFRPREKNELIHEEVPPLRGSAVHAEDVHAEDVHAEDVHPEDVHSEDDAPMAAEPPSAAESPRRRRSSDLGETSGRGRIPEPTPLRRSGDVTPLRRGARLRRSRRSLLLRLTRPFLLALAIVGVPLSLAFWFFRSPVFALSELEISRDQGGRVSEEWVRETLEGAQGWNLPRLPLPWIDSALKRHSWVQATALRKELPNRLCIRLIERREVAILQQTGAARADGEATFWYLDSSGAKITPYKPTDGETDLPIISVDLPERDARGALALLEEMDQTLAQDPTPIWTRGLSEIEVLGDRDFRVWTADLPFPLLVRSGTLAQKTPYLEKLLPEIVRRYEGIVALDLRFAGKIILQPKRLG